MVPSQETTPETIEDMMEMPSTSSNYSPVRKVQTPTKTYRRKLIDAIPSSKDFEVEGLEGIKLLSDNDTAIMDVLSPRREKKRIFLRKVQAFFKGKTYTIVGTPEQPGLIPRALEYVFKSVAKVSLKPEVKPLPNGSVQNMTEDMIRQNENYKNFIISATLCDQAAHIRTYKQMQNRLSMEPIAEVTNNSHVFVSAWISFAEIYNESIYDLLSLPDPKSKPRPRLALGKSKDESTYIKKLTSLHVTNGLEAYQILQYGLHNLNYACTAVNSHSSRSHCIFTIRLVQTSKNDKDVFISKFNFCDLAGSERLKKTMNFGDRLKESNNFNTSLLVLSRCMDNIKKCQQVKDNRLIPFRESKLTQIFEKALMGYEHVDMIVNVNLSRDMFDEIIHALNFLAPANTIVVEEELPKAIKKQNRFSLMMQTEEKTKDNKTTINEQKQKKLAEFQTITFLSDDDESPKKSRDVRRKELEEKISDYQTRIGELSDSLKKTQEKLELENMLKDVKEECRSSQLEVKRNSSGDVKPKESLGLLYANYHFGSNSSISSGSHYGSNRKKRPAPKPPIPGFLDHSNANSLASNSSQSVPHSPRATPKHRKNKRAPPPPTKSTSTPNYKQEHEELIKSSDNVFKEDFEIEQEKCAKEEVNRNMQSQNIQDMSLIEDPNSLTAYNKSTYGKWKRKKGQAPNKPVLQKRTIKCLPTIEIKKELELIKVQLQGLEKQGDDISIEAEDLILQLFELVNEKNELFRKQSELMYLKRQQRLEKEHADVEYQIRCLMMQPETNKTDLDKAHEEELIKKLVNIVERRNQIVECLEMDRVREAEEDDSISNHINLFALNIESDKSQLEKSKEKDKDKKKHKKENKSKHKNKSNLDADKDVDTSEDTIGTLEKKKKEKV